MPYCVNCGVKLSDSDDKCPLCQTAVYHPGLQLRTDEKPPFPAAELNQPKMNPKYKTIIAALALLIPALLCLVCDKPAYRLVGLWVRSSSVNLLRRFYPIANFK